MKAKKRLLEISNEKQIVEHTAEIKANPEQHKFLIGKNGASIKNVRDNTENSVIFRFFLSLCIFAVSSRGPPESKTAELCGSR
ncbi:hypothetical protein NPIL_417211 [Nephila pilipes]|uniref:K Homology domain-containing protein n=1 Tax=Nephila pilipes TaxID=299642 RepID=A0A8X6IMU5_NEPPI|nr:hypothetical protein NPIL_417211 [Nephila pilipes]